MQFSASALGGLPIGSKITELRFRLYTNGLAPSAFPTNTVSWSDYEVTLAQAAHPVSGMSTNFSSNMLSPVLVKSGTLSLAANAFTSSANLNPFCSFIVFDTPYFYKGGDLVMLFRLSGSDSSSTAFLDCVTSTNSGYGTDFRAFSAVGFAATGGSSASVNIAQIVYTYSPTQTISSTGTGVAIVGSGGPPGTSFRLLKSTNIASPISEWSPVMTNQFDTSGSFQYTTSIDASLPSQFFRIAFP
jgi:hypothetical protein